MDAPKTAADVEARRTLMRTLAHASDGELETALAALEPLPGFSDLRSPEVGLIMVRGRIGGDGAPFNLGEATVTRAAVRLESGETGFSYLVGRRLQTARLSAVVDALWQRPDWKARVESKVLAPLHKRQEEAVARQRARTAATKVDFFTVARGEDQ